MFLPGLEVYFAVAFAGGLLWSVCALFAIEQLARALTG